jgi:glutathione S-transferase
MPTFTLHFAPDTCARVPLIALEEIGCPYKIEIVAFAKGQHRSAEYLALNPKGKVPTLIVDGRPLTENVAILTWLAQTFPGAGLLPKITGDFEQAHILADLAFCASGLHPIVTRLRIPQFFCDTPEGQTRVFEMAEVAMRPNFAIVDQRLSKGEWWYGDRWSIVDAYINWIWFRVAGTSFDVSDFPNFRRHDASLKERPSVQRALAVNQEVADKLAALGLALKFTGPGAVAAPKA